MKRVVFTNLWVFEEIDNGADGIVVIFASLLIIGISFKQVVNFELLFEAHIVILFIVFILFILVDLDAIIIEGLSDALLHITLKLLKGITQYFIDFDV